MLAQCTVKGLYLMKIFDPHCVACIAVSLNDSVSSAYRNAFAGETERGRKQRDLAPKNKIHFVSKLIIFQNGTRRITY